MNPKVNRVKLNWRRVLLAFLAVIVTAVLIFLTLVQYFSVTEVQLPNIVGLSSEEAVQILNDLELQPRLFAEERANAIVNAVASQSPEAGSRVRKGRTVAVGVNKPDVRINVPSLIDISQTNIEDMLNNINLEIGQIDFAFSDAEKGRVIAQDPAAGSVASDKARVSIVVSRGPELAAFRMPEVRGLTIQEAKTRLNGLGLRQVEALASTVSSDKPDVVTAQVPHAGNMVTSGSHVVLNFALSAQSVTQVPSMVGVPLSQAQTMLGSAGLYLGGITYITDPAQSPGIVTYAPSSYTVRGAYVALTVNRANLTEPISNLSIAAPPVAGTQTAPPVAGGVNINPISQPTSTPAQAVTPTTPEINPTTVDTPQQTETPTNDVNNTTSGSSETTSSATTPNARVVPFNFDPASLGVSSLQNQAYNFKLILNDEQGERVIVDKRVNAGESVQESLSIYGEATVQTYINDLLYQAWNP